MPDSSGEAHVVVDLPDTPEIVVDSLDGEPIEGFEGHPVDEGDLEEDQEINGAV